MNNNTLYIQKRWRIIRILVMILIFVVLSFSLLREVHVLLYNKNYQQSQLQDIIDTNSANDLSVIKSLFNELPREEALRYVEFLNDQDIEKRDLVLVYDGDKLLSELKNENEKNQEIMEFLQTTEMTNYIKGLEKSIVIEIGTNTFYLVRNVDSQTNLVYVYLYNQTNVFANFADYFKGNLKSFIISIIILFLMTGILAYYIMKLMRKNLDIIVDTYEKEKYNLEQILYTDVLTGLYNRAYYNKIIEENNVRHNCTVIMADINGLKITNDVYGHNVGDSLIKDVSILLKTVFGNDLMFRMGGDEFLILSDKKRKDVEVSIVNFEKNSGKIKKDYVISVAFGISVCKNNEDLQNSIKIADANMYENKSKSSTSHKRKIIDTVMNQLYLKFPNEYEHSQNVVKYSKMIGAEFGLEKSVQEGLRLCALLHDVGKIGVPEEILSKSGVLMKDEYEQVKKHTEKGYQIIGAYPELNEYSKIILSHHERFDGKGYPQGLKGLEIPFKARIIAVADSFDAMVSERSYKKIITIEEAIEELKSEKGKQFDPKVVEAFIVALKKERF